MAHTWACTLATIVWNSNCRFFSSRVNKLSALCGRVQLSQKFHTINSHFYWVGAKCSIIKRQLCNKRAVKSRESCMNVKCFALDGEVNFINETHKKRLYGMNLKCKQYYATDFTAYSVRLCLHVSTLTHKSVILSSLSHSESLYGVHSKLFFTWVLLDGHGVMGVLQCYQILVDFWKLDWLLFENVKFI